MSESPSKTTAAVQANKTGMLAYRPRVGVVSYRVADIERSLRFYVGVLGMAERFRGDGLGSGERELIVGYPKNQGAVVMLMWNVDRLRPYEIGDGYNRVTLLVDNVRDALKYLEDQGTPVAVPAMDANNTVFAVVKDPDGYMIELLQLSQL